MGEGQWGEKGAWGLLAAVLLLGVPARAEPTSEASQPVVGVGEPLSEGGEDGEKDEEAKAEDEDEDEPRVWASGRVFARVSADEREGYERALSIPSARVGVNASLRQLEAEVSAELTSRTMLRDAYLRISSKDKRLRLYGGQFKSPFLERVDVSSWNLPLVRRGLVEDFLVDTHQLGGRRLGLMGEVKIKEAWRLEVSGGVFQGFRDEELDTTAGEDAALRVRVRPFKALTVGASSYLAEVFQGTRRHAVAADAQLRLGGLELSGEYATGEIAPGPFTAQLGLASFLWPVGVSGWALQPVAGAEALQLRGTLPARGYSFVGGLNLLYEDHFKAELQAEHALRAGDEAPGFEYSLQLATRF